MTVENIKALIHPEDWKHLQNAVKPVTQDTPSFQTEFRVIRPSGELRWCIGTAVASVDATDHIVRISGVTVDITDRKDAEDARRCWRARSITRAQCLALVDRALTRAETANPTPPRSTAASARFRARSAARQSRWQGADLARLVDEELAPYRTSEGDRIAAGPTSHRAADC